MVIVKTPLRISFVGGGSDVPAFYRRTPGTVVSTAIDKFVYAIVKERFDDLIYINYSRKECVAQIAEIRHDLVRLAMETTGVRSGVEITTLADIPSSGSGLGSSSSITVALLHALYAFQNQLVTAEHLAREACRIEIELLGKPIGRQDQYAAAYGDINQFVFHADDETRRMPVNMDNTAKRKFASSLLLYFTGMTRQADTILKEQKANLATADKYGVMEQMVSWVAPFREAMEKGDIAACGEIMDRCWALKRQMAAAVSNPQIEAMYARAKEAGALGGKIAGAGGGGFLLLVVPRERQNAVFEALQTYRELPFMIERSGSKVIFDDRAYTSK